MSYCTQSDIENIFGRDNVAIWSNLDNDTLAANPSRIDAAIAFADSHINSRLSAGRYALPLRGTAGPLVQITDIAARLAGIWLYEARGQGEAGSDHRATGRYAEMKQQIDRRLARIVAGQDQLPAVRRGASPDSPVVA